jgi:hypothetical protein
MKRLIFWNYKVMCNMWRFYSCDERRKDVEQEIKATDLDDQNITQLLRDLLFLWNHWIQ